MHVRPVSRALVLALCCGAPVAASAALPAPGASAAAASAASPSALDCPSPADEPRRVAAALPAGSDAEVLSRFLHRLDEPVRSFRARRRLEVASPRLGKTAWMDAEVELDPQRGFQYRVLDSGGSEMLQGRVLEKVLRTEQEVYAGGGGGATALTRENYDLSPGGLAENGLVRLRATARRQESGLLNGEFLVTPDCADLVQVSGTLAKGPAFWIPRVEMTKRYERILGHRVNVEVRSVSHARLIGPSEFTMTTSYEMIDGEQVGSQTAMGGSGGSASSR